MRARRLDLTDPWFLLTSYRCEECDAGSEHDEVESGEEADGNKVKKEGSAESVADDTPLAKRRSRRVSAVAPERFGEYVSH